jgi:glycine betaine/proline transport system permease protein
MTNQSKSTNKHRDDTTTELTEDYSVLVSQFAGRNSDYYEAAFNKIGDTRGFTLMMNKAALLLGPVWLGAWSLWAAFWFAFIIEATAVVLLGIGVLGDLGGEAIARADRLTTQSAERFIAAEDAKKADDPLAESMLNSARAIKRAADKSRMNADAERAKAPMFIALGLGLTSLLHIFVGALGNSILARQFRLWRGDRTLSHGPSRQRLLATIALVSFSYPVAIYRFAFADAPIWLTRFPASNSTKKEFSMAIDLAVKWIANSFELFFDSITYAINAVLSLMEMTLVGTPWPIVMIVILSLAWQISGPRVAIFSAAALAYLAILGFWEMSMATIALLGTAAFLAIVLGIPLGIWCGRNARLYSIIRPILDFMQTMPAFVYLIPVIAFFGIGKPPGIIATLIFGMPPVVRLTALGLSGVPEHIREAATAYGASKRFLLLKVDLPLAMPSIMTGVNQTLLMCLSMVVIASLIGSKGLGEDVLSALQYAAVGQGVLAGIAILMCAMVLDRIVQGRR